MRLLAISFLLTLLDATKASKGSSVDVALETVLEFNEAVDSSVIDKIKDIVKHIQNTFNENPRYDVPDEEKKPYNFTDFLKDAIIATNSYNDDELVELLDIIHSEIDEMDLKDVDYIRDYLKNNIANMKRDSKTARKNLDNLLNNLRNTNGNRKDNFYLNFINSLYKRNSEQKFLNILNRLNVFRRNGQSGNELNKVIRTALRDLVSELNITDDKRRILEMLFDEYNRNLNLSEIDDDDVQLMLPFYKKKLKTKTVQNKRQRTNSKYFNEKLRHTKENRVKLTHVTLCPENIEVIEKRKFIADTNDEMQNEFQDDIRTDKNESETQERIMSSSEVNSNSENDSDTQDRSNEITDVVKSNTRYKRTTQWTQFGTFRSKVMRTRKVKDETANKNYESTAETSSQSASGSFEQFGNLHKYRKTTNKNHKVVHKNNFKKRKNDSTLYKIFETDKIRRANYPETSNNEIKKTISSEPIANTQLKENKNVNLKNISKIDNSRRNMVLNSNTSITTKPIYNTSVTNLNITTKFSLITQITKPTKVIENTKKETETTITQITTEIANMTVFDVNTFIKNSEVQTIENAEKKKLIEKKMKEDLDALFSTTTTTTTTEVYADIFKGMEEEFNIS